jgi:hypothetical protein
VRVAAEVVSRSRSSFGPDGLSIKTGSGTPAAFLADLNRVAEATVDRVSLLGERIPAPYPLVAAAVQLAATPGRLSQPDRRRARAGLATGRTRDLEAAERALVEFALDNSADSVRKLAIRWRDALDVDDIEPREDELLQQVCLRQTLLPSGMKGYRLDLDSLSAAHLDAAIDAHVGNVIRAPRFVNKETADACDADHEQLADPRTLTQIAAEAIVNLARHSNACRKLRSKSGTGANSLEPLPAATIVGRMRLESLLSCFGEAHIDGQEQPISAKTARHLAADAGLIPEVLGGNSEVLDLGTPRRLYTHAQRIALAERDDGCA